MNVDKRVKINVKREHGKANQDGRSSINKRATASVWSVYVYLKVDGGNQEGNV